MGGGRSRGGGCAPPQKKFEFLPENGGFWCILGLLFTFMQKLVRSMGAAAPRPLDPPLNTGRQHRVYRHTWYKSIVLYSSVIEVFHFLSGEWEEKVSLCSLMSCRNSNE